MKFEFSRQIFEKVLNIKFHQNSSIGSRVVSRGQTDMRKLIVAFRNFANAPKKSCDPVGKGTDTVLALGLVNIPTEVSRLLPNGTQCHNLNKVHHVTFKSNPSGFFNEDFRFQEL
jgi:hypothetical protein